MSDPRSTKPLQATPASGEEAELLRLRVEIDAVDRDLLAALNRRASLVQQVGELKRRESSAIYSSARERDLVAALARENPGPFPNAGLAPVFREIVSATRSLEARLRVAFLGPEGTFSHLAARDRFGALADFVPVPTIPDVLAAVERGEADHGIVPVENTTEGVVTTSLDALLETSLPICGETVQRISHELMSQSGDLGRVRRVASHPQPLAQCRTWLDRHLPGVDRVETSSTVVAAEMAREHDDVAAIGSSLLPDLLGLQTLAPAIEDRRDNTTRFLVMGGDPPRPSENDLTCVAFTVRKTEAGALYRLLEPFAAHGVNLTSIQARPLKGRPWEYVFFIDLEGHESEQRVQDALAAAAACAHSHRVLGSFPRAPIQNRGEGA